jgi:uncharacterized Zn-finger protein
MKDDQMDDDVGWIDTLAWLPLGNTFESAERTQQSTALGFPSVALIQPSRNIYPSVDDLPYVCPKCHKRYRWKDSLRRHQRVECGLQPQHACPTCGRMFKHKHQMVAHGRIHHQQLH